MVISQAVEPAVPRNNSTQRSERNVKPDLRDIYPAPEVIEHANFTASEGLM